MDRKRIFKTKTFDRWAKKLLSDEVLCKAAREIEQGIYEADLGADLQKRVAIAGMGKSGGTRTLVAKEHEAAIFFCLEGRRALLVPIFLMPQLKRQRLSARACKHNP